MGEPALRCHALRARLVRLLLPLADFVLVDPAKGKQFFFVVNHFVPACAGERIIFHEKDRFFGADFLTKPAEDAAEHVDLKFLGRLLDIAHFGRAGRSRRRDADCFGRGASGQDPQVAAQSGGSARARRRALARV